MILAISPLILIRFSSNFAKAIFYVNPNSPENFVKLNSVFQKLDHLTCSKLKLRRPSITPIKLLLEFYYMANGLTFKILNIILQIFYRCLDFNRKCPLQNYCKEIGSILMEKSPKISRSLFLI